MKADIQGVLAGFQRRTNHRCTKAQRKSVLVFLVITNTVTQTIRYINKFLILFYGFNLCVSVVRSWLLTGLRAPCWQNKKPKT